MERCDFQFGFEEFRKNSDGRYVATDAIEKLIERTRAKYIVLSYNNNGRAALEAHSRYFEKA